MDRIYTFQRNAMSTYISSNVSKVPNLFTSVLS